LEEGEEATDELSVRPSSQSPGTGARNVDLNTAESLFGSILQANNKHANSMYSLAVLYTRVGENDKAKIMIEALLSVVDEATGQALRQQFSSVLQ